MKGEGRMLDAERPKESLDGELIVGHAGHVLANQRRMIQRMSRIAAGGAGIEGEPGGPFVAGVAQNVISGAIVGRTGGFGADAGGVVQQLFDGDLRLSRIAERLRPGDELKSWVVERHAFGSKALLAALGGNG